MSFIHHENKHLYLEPVDAILSVLVESDKDSTISINYITGDQETVSRTFLRNTEDYHHVLEHFFKKLKNLHDLHVNEISVNYQTRGMGNSGRNNFRINNALCRNWRNKCTKYLLLLDAISAAQGELRKVVLHARAYLQSQIED